jgi:hypothetical protein
MNQSMKVSRHVSRPINPKKGWYLGRSKLTSNSNRARTIEIARKRRVLKAQRFSR